MRAAALRDPLTIKRPLESSQNGILNQQEFFSLLTTIGFVAKAGSFGGTLARFEQQLLGMIQDDPWTSGPTSGAILSGEQSEGESPIFPSSYLLF